MLHIVHLIQRRHGHSPAAVLPLVAASLLALVAGLALLSGR